MYILVNQQNIIVASSTNKPSVSDCSGKSLLIYKVPKNEYKPEMIGQKLDDFEIVETR